MKFQVKDSEVNDLISMLNTMFHEKMSAEEKKHMLADRYNIDVGKTEVEEIIKNNAD